MERAAPGRLRGLVVNHDEGASDLQADTANAGDHFIPDDGRAEHCLEELDRRGGIRSEDMSVVETDSHSVYSEEL